MQYSLNISVDVEIFNQSTFNMVKKILFVILSLQFLNAVMANSTIIPNGELNYTAFKNSCIEKGSDGSVNSFWIFLLWKPNYEMVMSFAQFWDI